MSTTGDLIEVKLAFPTIVYKKITNSYVDAISNNKHVLSELHIEDRDIEIINKAVLDNINRDNIIMAYNKMKELLQRISNSLVNKQEITIYTDGSLQIGNDEINTKMGFEWTILTKLRISLKGKISKWPSSTRAKL